MTPKDWIQAASVGLMFVGLLGTFYLRDRQERGITTRMIQLLAVIFIFPVIIILSLNETLGKETAATLLGTLIGYLLSGLTKPEPKAGSEKDATHA